MLIPSQLKKIRNVNGEIQFIVEKAIFRFEPFLLLIISFTLNDKRLMANRSFIYTTCLKFSNLQQR